MKAEVKVELKEGVFDPEGENVKKALNLLGFSGVKNVKLAKVYTIEMDKEENVQEMCTSLLTNPVIHTYDIRKG
ncbi:MAG: phosphoribosylformylglycinamidine synthase subunit PurS [Theionarchaea archaeon]|nr:phosphoribosylformylglycinamidine synthase subunit PurS [Theionarchaea archaeon]MBU7001653.1 phosphoribosylformylglycinamidine synthase subunit PurS [Theionarchaea archaeon]MBU7020999.1 phosphoribosylformylglycinamidine synthase subunit PurS [Theionarchaea archaeon]MBU7034362.1 phosphoribosylformylglycinamidine synthase subunit PurS [Theionarchaea archaeon]MBU7041579.1 phosphoribosylformylglycinamidine synthase subunit PurS [Theionarchaea archaeon]